MEAAGLCNAVYVDDVADAVLVAAEREEAIGQDFLISGESPVTWRDFYDSYEQHARIHVNCIDVS